MRLTQLRRLTQLMQLSGEFPEKNSTDIQVDCHSNWNVLSCISLISWLSLISWVSCLHIPSFLSCISLGSAVSLTARLIRILTAGLMAAGKPLTPLVPTRGGLTWRDATSVMSMPDSTVTPPPPRRRTADSRNRQFEYLFDCVHRGGRWGLGSTYNYMYFSWLGTHYWEEWDMEHKQPTAYRRIEDKANVLGVPYKMTCV